MGPILIFDKSTLQSLNPDESVWLDNFFLTNITPLFFIETLADLEKEVVSGRTPEQVVGNLAYKTPDSGSRANVYHETLIAGELTGAAEVDMRNGRPIISGGKPTTLEGNTGIVFEQAPEEEALHQWQHGEFLELERLIAKSWRRALSNIDFKDKYEFFQKWYKGRVKTISLPEVKNYTDNIIDKTDQENALRFGLALIGFSHPVQQKVLARWTAAGTPMIREFAPYFRYVFSVDLFFYLAMAADLISRGRPSHKVDIAYLYYLPFCMVFTSNDNLHAKVAPLFLREDQTFVKGTDLKADLNKLDQHYSSLPEEVKNQGLYRFASYPPADCSFLVTQLWDKHLPKWREHEAEPSKPIDKEKQKAIAKEIDRLYKEATPLDPTLPVDSDEVHHIIIKRKVYSRKGKWKRFSPDIEQFSKNEQSNEL